jgi:hypothetical protein
MEDRPISQPEKLYARMVQVIESYGGKAPAVNEAGSLQLVAQFCWALGVKPRIELMATAPETEK